MANATFNLPAQNQRQPDTVPTELLDDYKYSSLVGQDIRMLELLPGDGDEDVMIRIRHCALQEAREPSKEDPRMSLIALRETLPQGWHVYETLEGRYLFLYGSSETHEWTTSTWRHPDPNFDASKYGEVPATEEYEEDLEKSQFEALSYAWGQPHEKPLYIRVEDGSQHFKLSVWPNLMSALRHLRPRNPSESRTMWVDAICLNQKDTVEKSLHIPRMREIYRLAYRTIVWLGPQCDVTGLAFETAEHIASQVEVGVDPSSELFPSPSAVEKWYGFETGLPSIPAEAWEALARLLSLSWFRRLWVVQEVKLNKHAGTREVMVYWGSHTSARSNLFKAFSSICYKFTSGWPLPRIVNAGLKLELEDHIFCAKQVLEPQNGAQLPSLRWLFRIHASMDCVDDRDRVYGLLGLAGLHFSEELKVSYDDTYGAADVNMDAVLTHIRLTGRLELLEPRGLSRRRYLVDAPSWVPDWAGRAGTRYFTEPTFPANNTRAHIKHDKDHPHILHVLGIKCTVIDELTDSLEWFDAENHWETLRHVRSWQPYNLDSAFYKPTGETMREAYAVTLIQAQVDTRWPHDDTPKMQQWVEQNYTNALFGSRSLAQDSDQGCSFTAQTMHQHVVKALMYCTGRRFFQTKEGYMGITNQYTRKGDIVAILLGCVTPVILRPVHDTDGQLTFSWVGECFVHGLHDSMKLLGPLPPPWKGILRCFAGLRSCLRFQNTETGEETWKDPRLQPLEGWERFRPKEMEQHYPIDFIFLRHRSTGEEITYDPRLEPEHLKARGVDLTWFTLV